MPALYADLIGSDFGKLTTLSVTWAQVSKDIDGLARRMRDEVLKALKDKGYWEGMAAPYAWAQIDDIERQLAAAAKVAKAMEAAVKDGAEELKAIQKELKDAVARARSKGMRVGRDGAVSKVVSDGGPGKDEQKEVDEAQDEINDILRRGSLVDQRLALTVQNNIGIDRWFNKGSVRSDINHTGDIGLDRINALERDQQGWEANPERNDTTPRGLLSDWITGTGRDDQHFTMGDKFTEQLRQSDSMKDIRADTIKEWENGNGTGRVKHKISSDGFLTQVGTYAQDMAGLSGIDNLWGGDTNEAQSLLGSYDVDYEVKGVDEDGQLVVQYTLTNDTDMESFLPGYPKWQEKLNHEHGPGRDIEETITWTERLNPEGS
ncbi:MULTISPECIES: hypothetical protein [unclassified Streptomyces]|jgi:hypothetical protein|uniref:hypothetical protein n=1 Tax=unclassified Streptomyces TaxID=2593676 RepID=UPI00368BD028